eukprot:CAMPEP_0203918658 /NCGR_PEP_ID=MMETSP0359-20131031/59154_1 /ASSEMBLY_ACC=CAM_ASM_000338 /TAXON_ID=268821 /ORGANISM="Scrippsiella Hangoei, Strain SHTV-5" /LENGTH=47 /DNA_ID= /DNA_START= /DNA_END= /DNA_ORIENTATION=
MPSALRLLPRQSVQRQRQPSQWTAAAALPIILRTSDAASRGELRGMP